MKITALTAMALAAAFALSGCNKPGEDPAFDAKVRAYLLAHPEVLQEAAAKLQEKERLAQQTAAKDAIAKYRSQLENDPRDLVFNPDGQFTVVEFFDYRCGYCKVVAPEVAKLIEEHRDVRFVFKEFPIFGEVSDTAARMALTPQGRTKGLELYKAWMNDRALTEAALDRHLAQVGLDPAAVRKASVDPAIDKQLQDVRLLARALGIQGTPAFIVGDYMIPGADIASLRAAITRTKAAAMKRPGSAT